MNRQRSFRVIRGGSLHNVSRVSFGGKPLARYRWNASHSAWIRTPMPPQFVLENTPEFPAVIRPAPEDTNSRTPRLVHP